MSDFELIVLHTGRSPEDVAELLSTALGLDLTNTPGGNITLSRPLRVAGSEDQLIAYVHENDYGEPDPKPDEITIYDGYDTALQVAVTTDDEAVLHAETSALFDQVITVRPWPAAHTGEGANLHSAWHPTSGRTDFPADTSPSATGYDLWKPYAHPEAPAAT